MSYLIKTIKSVITSIRDLILLYIPKWFAPLIIRPCDYTFIVHPVSIEDAAKLYPFAKLFPERMIHLWGKHYWPLIASPIEGFKRQDGSNALGRIIVVPMLPGEMIFYKELAQKKIVKAVRLSENIGAKYIGLGGFISILTKDGKYLEDKTKAFLTTGNSYSAAIASANCLKSADCIGIRTGQSTLAIVGAAGSVGSGCARYLCQKFKRVILVDLNLEQVEELSKLLKEQNANILTSKNIEAIREANMIITATSTPGSIIKDDHLTQGAVIIDASQPKNVPEDIIDRRKDILVVDSGIVKAEGISCSLDLGPHDNEIYSCLAEVLMMLWLDYKRHYSLGKADLNIMKDFIDKAPDAGMLLANFRNAKGLISMEKLKSIKKFYLYKE